MTLADIFAEQPPKPNGQMLLLIDDERINLLTSEAILKSAGFDVVSASSGEEAIALFPQYPFDAIITDIHMPIMDGFSTAQHLQALSSKPIPIAALTADPHINIDNTAINQVLAKPLNPEHIYAWLVTTEG